jgi:hypothetical protein
MGAPMRVVLDTNVVLSAGVFGGGLAYPKFHLSQPDQQQLLADFLPYTQTMTMPELAPPVPECRDPLKKTEVRKSARTARQISIVSYQISGGFLLPSK